MNTKKELEEMIATGKEIRYTLGLKYRHPSIYEVTINAERALELADHYVFDIKDKGSWIDFNCYTDNDLW